VYIGLQAGRPAAGSVPRAQGSDPPRARPRFLLDAIGAFAPRRKRHA